RVIRAFGPADCRTVNGQPRHRGRACRIFNVAARRYPACPSAGNRSPAVTYAAQMSRPQPKLVKSESLPLDRELLVRMHELMVKARVLEERLIQMYKQGHGYFWIGGPGEEAFNVPLGLLMKKGRGVQYD